MFGGRGAGRGQGGEAGERVWAMLVGGGHPDQHDQAVQNPGRGVGNCAGNYSEARFSR